MKFIILAVMIFSHLAWADVGDQCYQTKDCGDARRWACEHSKCAKVNSAYLCKTKNSYGEFAENGGCNSYGCWVPGGGCNSYGCYEADGGCNSYGCWYADGGCNSYGCWRAKGKCDSSGCENGGRASSKPFNCEKRN